MVRGHVVGLGVLVALLGCSRDAEAQKELTVPDGVFEFGHTPFADDSLLFEWGVLSDGCSVAVRVTAAAPGRWIGFGLGDGMVGGTSVVGLDPAANPGFDAVAEYNMSAASLAGIAAFDVADAGFSEGLLDEPLYSVSAVASSLQANVTAIGGTLIELASCGAPAGAVQSVLVAFGFGSELEFHRKHAVFNIDWSGEAYRSTSLTPSPSAAPLTESANVTAVPTSTPPAASVSPTPSPSQDAPGNSEYDVEAEVLPGVRLAWSVLDAEDGGCVLSLRATVPGNVWIGIGLGASMADGFALVASAAGVFEYSLSGRNFPSVQRLAASAGVLGTEWLFQGGERLLFANFTGIGGRDLSLGCGSGGGNETRRFLADPAEAVAVTDQVLVAVGSGLALGVHSTRVVLEVDWAVGEALLAGPSVASMRRVMWTHALGAVLAFAVLLPAAIILPIVRSPSGTWFRWHRALTTSAVLVAIGSAASGFSYVQESRGTHASLSHHLVGIVVLGLLAANPLLGILRPADLPTVWRFRWVWAHRLVGYSTVVAGLSNIVLGAQAVPAAVSPFSGGFAFFGLVVAFAIGGIVLLVANFVRCARGPGVYVAEDAEPNLKRAELDHFTAAKDKERRSNREHKRRARANRSRSRNGRPMVGSGLRTIVEIDVDSLDDPGSDYEYVTDDDDDDEFDNDLIREGDLSSTRAQANSLSRVL